MISYILRRLMLMVPTLVGITLVVFFTMALSPGGVAGALYDQERGMRPEEAQALRAYYDRRYGLNKPKIVQYLRWLNNVSPLGVRYGPEGQSEGFGIKWPDLGESMARHQKVIDVVADALPVTLVLNLVTIPLAYAVAILLGLYAGRHRGKWFDVTSNITLLAAWSIPVMWAGVMLIIFFANRDHFYWFPTGGLHSSGSDQMTFLPAFLSAGADESFRGGRAGWLFDTLWHLALPVICLLYGSFSILAKLMRSSVLENLTADFVRTARAKGVREHVVLFQHVLRNSLLPLITAAAGILPAMLGGSLLIETIFSIHGMGKLMIDAIFQRDREMILSVMLVISIISLLSLIVRDVCYALADPRVSFD